MKDEDNLFGEQETSSTTHGKWQMSIEPQMTYKLLNGTKTIVIDQNSKVSTFTNPLTHHSRMKQTAMGNKYTDFWLQKQYQIQSNTAVNISQTPVETQ